MLSYAISYDLLTISAGIAHTSRYIESQPTTSLIETVTARALSRAHTRGRKAVTIETVRRTTSVGRVGPEIDDTDLRLIALLEQDPRVSVLELATRLGCSRTAAKHRLDRLLEQGAVRVVGLSDDGLFGRPAIALLTMNVSRHPGGIAASLLEYAQVTWVATTSAVTTVLAQVAFSDNLSLSQFVDRSVRSLPGVERVFVDVIVAVLNPKRIDGGQNTAWMTGDRSLSAPDDIDRSIMEQLRRDGRTPFAKLAEVSGLSTPAARQRTLRLMADGRVRIRTIIDPVAIGLSATGQVNVSVRGSVEGVAARIAAMPAAHYVFRTFGSRDIYAVFRCASVDELLDALARVAVLDNVVDTDFYEFASESIKSPVWA
jgi:DNA-binding Lrp family transcriptional regulator